MRPLDPALAVDGVAELSEVVYGGRAPEWGRVEPCLLFGTDPDSGKNYDAVALAGTPGSTPRWTDGTCG